MIRYKNTGPLFGAFRPDRLHRYVSYASLPVYSDQRQRRLSITRHFKHVREEAVKLVLDKYGAVVMGSGDGFVYQILSSDAS